MNGSAVDICARPSVAAVKRLLAEAGLPTADLTSRHLETFFGIGSPAAPEGVIGVELHGNSALLRSLVVTPTARARGLGKALVDAAERCARSAGAAEIFLLTNTAERYFQTLGYERADRSTAPQAIQQTDEFTSLCPVNATFMHKRFPPRATA